MNYPISVYSQWLSSEDIISVLDKKMKKAKSPTAVFVAVSMKETAKELRMFHMWTGESFIFWDKSYGEGYFQ